MNAEAQFHAERLTGLGGSDLGAVLGLSPYRTPYEVWMEKTGRAEPFDGNLATRFGTFAEQFVAEEYTRQTGRAVQRFNAMLRHPSAPLIGHVDRLVVPAGAKRASHKREIRTDTGLECKTASAYATVRGSDWGEDGTDQIPESYLIQCAVYKALTGCEHWDLAALIGGNADFRIYHIHRDRDLEDMLITEADKWWRAHVIADTPPDPSSEAEARQRWARHRPGRILTLSADQIAAFDAYRSLKAQQQAAEKAAQAARDVLIPMLEDADEIVDSDGRKLGTYRANKDSARIDWKSAAAEMAEFIGADAEQVIERHTSIQPGARVLRLAKQETLT